MRCSYVILWLSLTDWSNYFDNIYFEWGGGRQNEKWICYHWSCFVPFQGTMQVKLVNCAGSLVLFLARYNSYICHYTLQIPFGQWSNEFGFGWQFNLNLYWWEGRGYFGCFSNTLCLLHSSILFMVLMQVFHSDKM